MKFSKKTFCDAVGLTGPDPRRIFRPHVETITDDTGARILGELGTDLACFAFVVDRERRLAIRSQSPAVMKIDRGVEGLVMNSNDIRFSGFPGIFDPVEMRIVSRYCVPIAVVPFLATGLFQSDGEIVYESESVAFVPRIPDQRSSPS